MDLGFLVDQIYLVSSGNYDPHPKNLRFSGFFYLPSSIGLHFKTTGPFAPECVYKVVNSKVNDFFLKDPFTRLFSRTVNGILSQNIYIHTSWCFATVAMQRVSLTLKSLISSPLLLGCCHCFSLDVATPSPCMLPLLLIGCCHSSSMLPFLLNVAMPP